MLGEEHYRSGARVQKRRGLVIDFAKNSWYTEFGYWRQYLNEQRGQN